MQTLWQRLARLLPVFWRQTGAGLRRLTAGRRQGDAGLPWPVQAHKVVIHPQAVNARRQVVINNADLHLPGSYVAPAPGN